MIVKTIQITEVTIDELADKVAETIKSAFSLLGIEVPERM